MSFECDDAYSGEFMYFSGAEPVSSEETRFKFKITGNVILHKRHIPRTHVMPAGWKYNLLNICKVYAMSYVLIYG